MKQLKLVLIGGGTGLSVLARGLKSFPIDITAIVTVADDGGSTGKIRSEMDIPAPGDVRNVLVALSDVEPLLEQLFQYRFEKDIISGHSVGNLLIAALTNITNDFGHAVKELSKILNIKGRVIPSTNSSVALNAEMEDGEIVTGESNIPRKHKKIKRVFLEPADVKPMDEAVVALREADLIVLGPGSLYTSVISNLCVNGIAEAIVESDAKKLYVSNIMTQPGETDEYTVTDHIRAIHQQLGANVIDFVIANQLPFSQEILQKYEDKGAKPVYCDEEVLKEQGVQLVTGEHLAEITEYEYVRHRTEILAEMIYEIALQEISTIQFDPDQFKS
ncbi:YvcK family protein [Staphylococcus schleiferi]|uniref:gluconeogenesis factor YvcK family protein n=1 Tax=Staphylococcus schleiferi TaxID=1295 RepID=UPI001888E7C4|nr:YvcK family protein [Staphylococcus schleiferi]MBF1991915.1 YvcK family protein [Staphylococcus schleiferi]MBF2037625.1 YvcK family protein [Staphylococcus schleiferi]MBF2099577.1 YvcK family protein [Staphylococcus schleiferi]MBF2101716.1 YvcK family protein [Staphylococcus schleiferi]MBF2103773.1 YvcK family protein [Staphylococcus schleiferi]